MGNATYSEEELLPISGLQHLAFCERQCALIHIERVWEENLQTAEGRLLHERVHREEAESRGSLRFVRGLPLRSLDLGLWGVADLVEFHRRREEGGEWEEPMPVEYKRGKPKPGMADERQLCAQALCLEEMTGARISRGMLFYLRTRRRVEVVFDEEMRESTGDLARRFHELMESGVTPAAVYGKKCRSCSLVNLCMPRATGGKKRVARYLGSMLESISEEGETQ